MTSSRKKSFLVFSGGNDRGIISFLRALHLCGLTPHIVARTRDDRILRTHYKKYVRWIRPTHELTFDIFVECLRQVRIYAQNETMVILPSTEYLNSFLLQHRSEIERLGCEIPLVHHELYNKLTSKRTATDFFTAAGIASPAEISKEACKPPLVAKPLRNISAQGKSLYPQLLRTPSELDKFLRTQNSGEYFFQEFAEGKSIYLLFYMSRAEGTDFVWSQRNILQQPKGKSMLLARPSNFHRSCDAARIIRALRHAGFSGLGMVEVIQQPDRNIFIEMNPRIWGPIQFCIDQKQLLLQAFIGEALHNAPTRYIHCVPTIGRNRYFWAGGLMDTITKGLSPTQHTSRKSQLWTMMFHVKSDVYLRRDSWRCFAEDLITFISTRKSCERLKD